MLVITHRKGEEIVIGDPKAPLGIICIKVIKSDRVRVSLEFPKEVPVNRREVADEILRMSAASSSHHQKERHHD